MEKCKINFFNAIKTNLSRIWILLKNDYYKTEHNLDSSRNTINLSLEDTFFIEKLVRTFACEYDWHHLRFVWIFSHGLNFHSFDLKLLQYFYVSMAPSLQRNKTEHNLFLFLAKKTCIK